MSKFGNSFIWHEKYSPQTVQDTILPRTLKSDFLEVIEKGDFQHLLFSGTAGIGKTTLAKALCNQLGLDYIYINASLENGIDVLRTKILEFASTVSLMGASKAVILDEADGLGEPIQKALRGFMDEFNVRFIMTCNFPHRIIDPLKDSRVSHYKFDIPESDKNAMMRQMYTRIVTILEAESVTFDPDVVKSLVRVDFPNFRKMLVNLQRYSARGSIDVGILGETDNAAFQKLISILRRKQFKEMCKWVVDNADMNKDKLFQDLFDNRDMLVKPASAAQLICTVNTHQYQSTFAISQVINTTAMLSELLNSCDFLSE